MSEHDVMDLEQPIEESPRAIRARRTDLQPVSAFDAPWTKHLTAALAGAPEPEPVNDPVSQARAAIDRRARVMRSAGPVDPDAVEVCAPALDECPRVAGHEGSVAAAKGVEAFVLNPKLRTLALLGAAGRGKTWAATWALPTVKGAAVWHPANEVRIPAWDDARSRCAAAELLVVDDLGREPNDWAAREICDLVESRHNRGARTVLTTNLPLRLEDIRKELRAAWKGRTLADRYGDRFVSRLLDAQRALLVRCLGDDLRRTSTT